MKDVKEIEQFVLKVKDIKNLEVGEEIFIPKSDYGLAEIYCVKGDDEKEFELYSISMYDGELTLEKVSSSPIEIFDIVTNWC